MSVDKHRTQPLAQPTARYTAVILGLLLLGLVGVVIRELWSMRTDSDLESWAEPITQVIGRATYQPWMLPAGIASIVLGIILIYIAFRPRTRTHRPLASTASLWTRSVDIARMCTAASEKVPGVMRAYSVATNKRVTVNVHGDVKDPTLQSRVEAVVEPLVAELEHEPDLAIRIHRKED